MLTFFVLFLSLLTSYHISTYVVIVDKKIASFVWKEVMKRVLSTYWRKRVFNQVTTIDYKNRPVVSLLLIGKNVFV